MDGIESGTIEGVDAGRVTAWFEKHIDGVVTPLSFSLIAGGRSNLTFEVTDALGHRYVLRRPPVSHVLQSAHDMGREYRIVSALAPTPVPVAPVLGFCDDETVNGAPFYVMSFVEGHILRDAAGVTNALDVEARWTAGTSLVDVLADIHAVDPDAVGLGSLGRKEAYIARQLKRWYGQFQSSNEITGRPLPLVHELHDLLSASTPDQGPASIVHGDYRLDNTVMGSDGSVQAVLDWEICTLGDPLADIGLLMVYWSDPGDDNPALLLAPTVVEGFPLRTDLAERYAERSGRDLSALPFYVAFGYWKLACILEGVYARYRSGAMGGDRSGADLFEQQVVRLAEQSKTAASQL